jgi:signal transduction histidine kinase
VAVSPIAYRSDLKSHHILRVAGWNVLGIIATVVVVWLVSQFQAATGGDVTAPLLSGGLIVGVSAFAHVLIGFNDVRRIRFQTVAKQRQKAAVMNRFVRHNLNHAAQVLLGYGGHLERGGVPDAEQSKIGQKISDLATELSETEKQINVIDDLLEQDQSRDVIDVAPIITEQQSTWEEQYPNATIDIELEQLPALVGDHIDTALQELVGNAFEHGGDPPTVVIRGKQVNETIQITIEDTGDGVPAHEQVLINEDQTESQLQHSSGLGLWLAKWIIELYDGVLSVTDRQDGAGTVVTVHLPKAS